KREVERGLGQWQHRLGHADEMRRLLRGDRDLQRLRVRQSDVLGGGDDQASRHEQRILAGLEHSREPVDGRVGVAASHALDERRDDVVVLVAGAVIKKMSLLQRALDVLERDLVGAGQSGRGFESVERHARVAARCLQLRVHRVGADRRVELAQTTLDDALQLVAVEGFEPEHAAAREQRSDDFEGTIRGGRADERDGPVLDVGQDRVLLGLVEAMDLVDEQHGAHAGALMHGRLRHRLAQVGDAGRDRAHGHHPRLRLGGQEPGERGLPAARWSPQDDARQVARLGELAQHVDHAPLVVEVDHAEHVHNELGQAQVNALLAELAEALGRAIRDTDTLGFLESDKSPHFVIILPETDEQGATLAADKIRRSVAAHDFSTGGRWQRITVSCGASTIGAAPVTYNEEGVLNRREYTGNLLREAYYALDHGRSAGTNRTSVGAFHS